jgi:formylmethanofuran dehydrogenase subunit B
MSIDPQMQMAVEKDQVVVGEDAGEAYPDNISEIEETIRGSETKEELQEILQSLSVDNRKKVTAVVNERLKEINSLEDRKVIEAITPDAEVKPPKPVIKESPAPAEEEIEAV